MEATGIYSERVHHLQDRYAGLRIHPYYFNEFKNSLKVFIAVVNSVELLTDFEVVVKHNGQKEMLSFDCSRDALCKIRDGNEITTIPITDRKLTTVLAHTFEEIQRWLIDEEWKLAVRSPVDKIHINRKHEN